MPRLGHFRVVMDGEDGAFFVSQSRRVLGPRIDGTTSPVLEAQVDRSFSTSSPGYEGLRGNSPALKSRSPARRR